MRFTIEIDDKLGEKIKQFCKLNNITYSKYLVGIIEEKFNCDRFGDLNEKINRKRKMEQPKMVKVEEDVAQEEVEEEVNIQQEDIKKKETNKTTRQLKIK